MTFNSLTVRPENRYAATAFNFLSKYAHRFLSMLAWLGGKANSALKTMQVARMMSALTNMSDHQLAQIGIQRSDIPKYAETLMANE
jgi:uncharacterized protein YjiS (DUF1127 family)